MDGSSSINVFYKCMHNEHRPSYYTVLYNTNLLITTNHHHHAKYNQMSSVRKKHQEKKSVCVVHQINSKSIISLKCENGDLFFSYLLREEVCI